MNVFVVMPLAGEFDWVYDGLIKEPFEAAGYEVYRADDLAAKSQQNILKDIVTNIDSADLVVADLTGNNPNVYYELGLAHGRKKNVILLAQNIKAVPFDLQSYRVMEYGMRPDLFKDAKDRLQLVAAAASKGEITFGNPVTDFGKGSSKGDTSNSQAQENVEEEEDEHDEELGFVDLALVITETSDQGRELLEAATSVIQELGSHAEATGPELVRLGEQKNARAIKARLVSSGLFFSEKADTLHGINLTFRSVWDKTAQAMEKQISHPMMTEEQREKDLKAIQEMCDKASVTHGQVKSFAAVVNGLPDVERTWIKAKRKLARELESFASICLIVESLWSRVKSLEGNQ